MKKIERLLISRDKESDCSHCGGECDGGDDSGPDSGDSGDSGGSSD